MSRTGVQPISVPAGVTVTLEESCVRAKGPQGELTTPVPGPIQVEQAENVIRVTRQDDTKASKSLHGLTRSLIANMVEGVDKGYEKVLEVEGVGYRADMQGTKLVMALGFASPIEYQAPAGVAVMTKGNAITVSGPDKQQVGDTAARIRSFYPPEPYKGKGIRYRGEHVKRKAGKTVA